MADLELTPAQWDKILTFHGDAPTSTLGAWPIASVSSPRSSGLPAPAPNGGCCPQNTATGTPLTSALGGGVTGAFGRSCISIWPRTPTPSISSLTARWCVPTRTPLAPKNGRTIGPSFRAQLWRVQHQGAHHRGRSGQPIAVHPDGRAGSDIAQAEALLAGYAGEYVIGDNGSLSLHRPVPTPNLAKSPSPIGLYNPAAGLARGSGPAGHGPRRRPQLQPLPRGA